MTSLELYLVLGVPSLFIAAGLFGYLLVVLSDRKPSN